MTPIKSILALWLLAPLLLALSLVRPPNPSSDRATSIPKRMDGFTMSSKEKITPAHEKLLGTRDVAWRVYEDEAGNEYYLTMVFHDRNWKSLHPPHICIRGSNFDINTDGYVSDRLNDGRRVSVGRIVASKRNNPDREYVSIYAFAGMDFVTPRYWRFYLHHFFPAMIRQSTSGFLLRVEAFVGRDGVKATERRCWRMFKKFLPLGESLVQHAE